MQYQASILLLTASLFLSTSAIPTGGNVTMASVPSQLGGGDALAYNQPATGNYNQKDSAYPTQPNDASYNDDHQPRGRSPARSPVRYPAKSPAVSPARSIAASPTRSPAVSPARSNRSYSPAGRSPSCDKSRANSRSRSRSRSRSSSMSSRSSSVSSRSKSRSRSRSMSFYRGRRVGGHNAFGRYDYHGRRGAWSVRGRCRRRRAPYMNGGYPQLSAYGGGYGGYDGQGVDDYNNSRYGGSGYGAGYGNQGGYDNYGQGHGYGGYGDPGYGGGYGGRYGGRSSRTVSDYERHQHSENVHDSSRNSYDRYGGRYSAHDRHADESYLDESGHNMSMTDRYGQHASEHDDSFDAGRREADSHDVHIRRPDGSMVDSSNRDGSVDTVSEDDHSRSFSGPNHSAQESEHDFSENSDQFSSSNQRIVN